MGGGGGGDPETRTLARMDLPKAVMKPSNKGMNPWKPGYKHRNHATTLIDAIILGNNDNKMDPGEAIYIKRRSAHYESYTAVVSSYVSSKSNCNLINILSKFQDVINTSCCEIE